MSDERMSLRQKFESSFADSKKFQEYQIDRARNHRELKRDAQREYLKQIKIRLYEAIPESLVSHVWFEVEENIDTGIHETVESILNIYLASKEFGEGDKKENAGAYIAVNVDSPVSFKWVDEETFDVNYEYENRVHAQRTKFEFNAYLRGESGEFYSFEQSDVFLVRAFEQALHEIVDSMARRLAELITWDAAK